LGLPCKSLLKLEDTFWKEQGLVSLAEIKFQKLKNVALTAPPSFSNLLVCMNIKDHLYPLVEQHDKINLACT
jgi:hypothetical protein